MGIELDNGHLTLSLDESALRGRVGLAGGGARVVANFGPEPFALPGVRTVPPLGCLID